MLHIYEMYAIILILFLKFYIFKNKLHFKFCLFFPIIEMEKVCSRIVYETGATRYALKLVFALWN